MTGQVILNGTMLAESPASQSREAERMANETTATQAVEQLVREHARFVFRIAFSILRDHHEAQDAAQECFLRVLKVKQRLPEVREQKTWLARIAWRCALDRSQKLRSRLHSDLSLSGSEGEDSTATLAALRDSSADPEQLAASAQMSALLERVVATLPEDLRITLQISTLQELTSGEVAAVLGIPEGSVRTRLMRARKLLKQKLQQMLGETL
jgi:RNA polymerase sigma-70 factor (ECF subfamily)